MELRTGSIESPVGLGDTLYLTGLVYEPFRYLCSGPLRDLGKFHIFFSLSDVAGHIKHMSLMLYLTISL